MLTSGLIAGNQAVRETPWSVASKESAALKASTRIGKPQPVLSSVNPKTSKVDEKVKANVVTTVCNLCPVTCEMKVEFDGSGNVASLTGDQCESGKVFVEKNKAVLLANIK